jgi:hypothetical protein
LARNVFATVIPRGIRRKAAEFGPPGGTI